MNPSSASRRISSPWKTPLNLERDKCLCMRAILQQPVEQDKTAPDPGRLLLQQRLAGVCKGFVPSAGKRISRQLHETRLPVNRRCPHSLSGRGLRRHTPGGLSKKYGSADKNAVHRDDHRPSYRRGHTPLQRRIGAGKISPAP